MGLSENAMVRVLLSERARLLAYVWSIVRDATLAEDVFQEVSLLAVEKRNELRDEKALPTWLRRTARFKALAAIRDSQKDRLVLSAKSLDQIDAAWRAQDDTSHEERTIALRQCLSRLSPSARRIVALRYIEGLSGKKVAEVINRSAHTTYVALSRIHNKLRDCIQEKLSVKGSMDG